MLLTRNGSHSSQVVKVTRADKRFLKRKKHFNVFKVCSRVVTVCNYVFPEIRQDISTLLPPPKLFSSCAPALQRWMGLCASANLKLKLVPRLTGQLWQDLDHTITIRALIMCSDKCCTLFTSPIKVPLQALSITVCSRAHLSRVL